MQTSLDVTLITPEAAPLEVFGETVTRGLSALFAERRIEAITSAWGEMPQSRKLIVHPGRRELEFDRIVALPALRGPDLPGLPSDDGGFLPVDEYGHVRGVDRVWAAGDCTDQPIKMGAVAAGLADVAAESIAEMFGAHVHGRTFVPTIEGVLMTGGTPRYLRARPASPGASRRIGVRDRGPRGAASRRSMRATSARTCCRQPSNLCALGDDRRPRLERDPRLLAVTISHRKHRCRDLNTDDPVHRDFGGRWS